MINIDAVQQQITQFLADRGHCDTNILTQSYLIAVVGIRTVFADATAIWLFDETSVRVDDKDGRVLFEIEADVAKKAA